MTDPQEAASRRADGCRARSEREIYVPGHWRCAQCGFFNVRAVLNAYTGQIGVGSDADVCPNDGTLMQRVKWSEIAKDQEQSRDETYQRVVTWLHGRGRLGWANWADELMRVGEQAEQERDALKAALEQARELIRVIQNGREWSHMTYNGGHEGEMCQAFHHGMDTVYNVIDAEIKKAALTPAPGRGHA